MLDKNVHRLLALFGDANPHSFFEIVTLGRVLLKKPERTIEKTFKRYLLENVWVERLWESWDPRLDMYQLTEKGDRFFRSIQIWRLTRGIHTEDEVRHFQVFNRRLHGKFGVEGMSRDISEITAGLHRTHPHLYG